MNNILCFAFEYLKRTFKKKSHEIGPIKSALGMDYLLNKVQYIQFFASKYLKQTLKRSHKIVFIK